MAITNPYTYTISPVTNTNTSYSEAMRLDASGNLSVGTSIGTPQIQIGNVALTQDIARYLIGKDLHPAFAHDKVEALLCMASSSMAVERIFALKQADFPLARAVMMCNDHDNEVRATAEAVVLYAQQQVKENEDVK